MSAPVPRRPSLEASGSLWPFDASAAARRLFTMRTRPASSAHATPIGSACAISPKKYACSATARALPASCARLGRRRWLGIGVA
jgi:hypothetical protein